MRKEMQMAKLFVGPSIRRADARWRSLTGDAKRGRIAASSVTRAITVWSLANQTDYRRVLTNKTK